MLKTLATTTVLFMSLFSFAQNNNNQTPVLQGVPAKVTAVTLEAGEVIPPQPGRSAPPSRFTLRATIEYNGLCGAPSSFVIVEDSKYEFSILTTHQRNFGNVATCQAIDVRTKEISVARFFDEDPGNLKLIKVNGMGVN